MSEAVIARKVVTHLSERSDFSGTSFRRSFQKCYFATGDSLAHYMTTEEAIRDLLRPGMSGESQGEEESAA